MRKTALTFLLFALTFGVAGAASVNGDFEGNPIVKVQSGSQELKVEDVPATIYKGRTVVPVYLLRQLGANVDWNSETYTVNVTLPAGTAAAQPQPQQPQQPDAAQQERELLKNAYLWLKDTDSAMVLFAQELQQYASMDDRTTSAGLLEEDFKKLNAAFDESFQTALKVISRVKDIDGLRSIMDSQTKALDQIRQTKNLLLFKQTTNNTDFDRAIPLSLLSATRSALQNQLNTNDYLHKLQAQEMKLN